MPAFIVMALLSVAGWVMKYLGPQLLIALGVGLVSYTGFHALSDDLTAYVNAMSSSLSSLNVMLHMLGVYTGVQIMLSVVSIKISYSLVSRVLPVKASS